MSVQKTNSESRCSRRDRRARVLGSPHNICHKVQQTVTFCFCLLCSKNWEAIQGHVTSADKMVSMFFDSLKAGILCTQRRFFGPVSVALWGILLLFKPRMAVGNSQVGLGDSWQTHVNLLWMLTARSLWGPLGIDRQTAIASCLWTVSYAPGIGWVLCAISYVAAINTQLYQWGC